MRAVLLLVVVAVLALGSWWVLRSEPGVAPMPTAPTPRVGETPPTPTPMAAETTAPVAREEVAETAATGQLPIPADATWVEILVIDKVTREPAPNVEVLWSNGLQQARIDALPIDEMSAVANDVDQRIERFGWRASTDQHGKVRVTTHDDYALVVARDEHRYGVYHLSTKTPSPEQGHRLELVQDHTVTVHVTDIDGRDVPGIRVGMQPFDPGTDEQPRVFDTEAPRTDAHGLTAFRHVQDEMTWDWGTRRGRPVGALQVSICMPGFAADPVTLDPQNLPTDPVELQLPASGELVVRVLFEGQPVPDLRKLKLHAGPKHDSDAANGAMQEPIDDDGRARFRHVALGKQFFVAGNSWSVAVPGPTVPGQVASCTIDLAEHVFAISGRLLDESGPLASTHVPTQFRYGTGGGGGAVATDADGRFLWIVRDVWEGEPELELGELVFVLMRVDHPQRRCDVTPRKLRPGRNELGDLRCLVDALIVGGRMVFDCEGHRAWPGVQRFDASSGQGSDGRWERVELPWPNVTDDGRFELRGKLDPGRYRLVVEASDLLPVEPIEFAPGTADLEVRVRCGSTLEATCLIDERLDAQLVKLELVAADRQPEPRPEWAWQNRFVGKPQRRDADRPERVRFRWQAVEIGRYTLRICGADAQPVVEIPDVVLPLPAGGDPRLADIDLRTTLTLLHLRIRHPEGPPDRRAQELVAFLMPQPDEQLWRGFQLPQNELLLPVPPGQYELLICGHTRPLTLRGVAGSIDRVVDVEPEPWPRVELTFAGTELVPADVRLEVRTSQSRPDRDDRRFSTPNQAGPLSGLLHFNGDYAVVENGRATVRVGDGETNLRVGLRLGQQYADLERYTPRKIVDAKPSMVQLSADELREVVARLQAKASGR